MEGFPSFHSALVYSPQTRAAVTIAIATMGAARSQQRSSESQSLCDWQNGDLSQQRRSHDG